MDFQMNYFVSRIEKNNKSELFTFKKKMDETANLLFNSWTRKCKWRDKTALQCRIIDCYKVYFISKWAKYKDLSYQKENNCLRFFFPERRFIKVNKSSERDVRGDDQHLNVRWRQWQLIWNCFLRGNRAVFVSLLRRPFFLDWLLK